jgi:hypothetical protein
MVAEYATGTPAPVLAERSGLSVDTITRHARPAGIKPPARSNTRPQDQIDQIAESYTQGERTVTIAQHLGIGHQHVRRVLVAADVQVRPKERPPIPASKTEQITRLHPQG